ncbi:luciferase oxidoreductase [Candidatus Protofrankia californiensis]|uniref:Luciferase oxidoreductase n=1 Tax=Candidatus Protofrankia californiensis TaxID=1839754 RepID=A0A1C3PAI7_9ACTN|nr:luciferase oxidoreductase [Candidatus Protofrankia californiensis]
MKFVALSLIINSPDPKTGVTLSQHDKLASVLAQAELVEQLGYDAYQIGERHGAPFLCSSPAVLLTAVAARTSRVRLLTGVTVLSIHDPVQVAEEYALLDHLSGGRLDLVIAKGNHAPHYSTFGLDPAEQWDVLAEKYDLLRRLWSEENVTWSGRYRAPLVDVTTQPRPYQRKIRVWHGSATSRQTTELAALRGDPLYSANGFFRVAQYRELIDHYRQRWAHYGHSGEPLVASAFPALLIRKTSQEAVEAYRPFWNAQRVTPAAKHNKSPFWELEEFIEHGSALVGSPEQVLDKIHRFTEEYGQQLTGIGVDSLPVEWQREQLEWFANDIVPDLRRAYPSSLWAPEAAAELPVG